MRFVKAVKATPSHSCVQELNAFMNRRKRLDRFGVGTVVECSCRQRYINVGADLWNLWTGAQV